MAKKDPLLGVLSFFKQGLVLVCTLLICGLTLLFLTSRSKEKTFAIEGAAKIEVFSGTTGLCVDVTDEDTIQQITDNINSITFKRESKIASSGFRYHIDWYDTDGQIIESIGPGGDDHMFYDDYNWYAVSGKIDMGFLDDLYEKYPAHGSVR